MRIGFIGLGTMGGRMAANLRKGGFDLTVHDKRKTAAEPFVASGCRWAETPREIAAASELVFTSLPEPTDVEQVMAGPNGLLEGLTPGAACFDLSTNSPSVVRRLHELSAERQVHFLDAPSVAVRGPIGSAMIAKLVHNCAGYILNRAMAEVFTMGVKAGVDPLTLWTAVRQGALGRMRTFDSLARHFLPGKFDPPDFALRLAHKDVMLATEVGRELRVPMPMGNLALDELTVALNRGWGDRDSRAAMLQEERAGVQIAVDPQRLREALEKDRSAGGAAR
jgi:3-hydroxyisobutyrate dehydrogenase-like beta-hydroxyacid dehydrogenase